MRVEIQSAIELDRPGGSGKMSPGGFKPNTDEVEMRGRIGRTAMLVAATLLTLLAGSCDNEHNVNAGNLITVSGYVFQSPDVRVGVADITVVIEKSEESSSPTILPDIIVHTDQNGRYEARFTLGYAVEDGTTGGTTGGSSTSVTNNDPYTPIPQVLEESMRILMVSPENNFFDLGSGFTFQAGKKYDIWPVFLSDFGAQAAQ